jgi:predicted Holliday junction resolvase-like endonuclease
MTFAEKIMISIILLVVMLATGAYLYIEHLQTSLASTKDLLRKTKQTIVANELRYDRDIAFCEKQVDMEAMKSRVEKDTYKEIEEKQDNGKSYEILATSGCGCYRDSNGGWVFK